MYETETFEVIPHADGWVVRHRNELSTAYATKQAALEAAAAAAENLVARGAGAEIRVPAGGPPQGSPTTQ